MLAAGVMVAWIKKRYERRRVVEAVREIVRGTEALVQARIEQTTQRWAASLALINTFERSCEGVVLANRTKPSLPHPPLCASQRASEISVRSGLARSGSDEPCLERIATA